MLASCRIFSHIFTRRTMIISSSTTKRSIAVINESDIIEKFVLGGGPGGQNVNKTRNRVQLTHVPTGIQVHCQDERYLETNRKIARNRLRDKVDQHLNGEESRLSQKFAKIRRRKDRASRRGKEKYQQISDEKSPPNDNDDV